MPTLPSPLKKKIKHMKVWLPICHEQLLQTPEICWVVCPRWRTVIMQKLRAFEKGSWNYACMKIVFLLFLSHGVARWLCWSDTPHTTKCFNVNYICGLIYSSTAINCYSVIFIPCPCSRGNHLPYIHRFMHGRYLVFYRFTTIAWEIKVALGVLVSKKQPPW